MPAPITSYGYAGTIAPNAVWAQLQWALGVRYWVKDYADIAVTPIAGTNRQVSIAGGQFACRGILNILTSAYTFAFPSVTSTTWFLLAARHTFGGTQATDFVAINAGTGAALPTRNTTIGVLDDQPIALVQVNQNGTIGTIRDLRVFGGKDFYIARDELVLSYMSHLGAIVRIGDRTYRRVLDAAGSTVWKTDATPLEKATDVISETGTSIMSAASGWSGSGLNIRGTRYGNLVQIDLELARTGATIQVGVHGEVDDVVMGTVSPVWRPTSRQVFSVYYIGGDAATDRGSYMGLGSIASDGTLYFNAGQPSMDLVKQDAGSRCLSATLVFIQR